MNNRSKEWSPQRGSAFARFGNDIGKLVGGKKSGISKQAEREKKTKEKKKLEKRLIDDFVLRFKAINTDDKWRLPSDRFVEDVLYDWAVTHRSETWIFYTHRIGHIGY